MRPEDLDYYNPISIYEELLKELLLTASDYIDIIVEPRHSKGDSGWLPFLFNILDNKAFRIIDLMNHAHFSISKVLKYLKRSEVEVNILRSLKILLPSKFKDLISPGLQEELTSIKEIFFDIEAKNTTLFIDTIALHIDSKLRETGVNISEYIIHESRQIDFVRLLDIASISEAHNKVCNDIIMCRAYLSDTDLSLAFMQANETFNDAVDTATTLDEITKEYKANRLQYLYQNLDIHANFIGGVCHVDNNMWLSRSRTSPHISSSGKRKFKQYNQLHFTEESHLLFYKQYKHEQKSLRKDSNSIILESKVLSLHKTGVTKTKQAQSIAIKAIFFLLSSRHKVKSIELSFHDTESHVNHITGLKMVNNNSVSVLQFRDVNAGCFEFNHYEKFINWFPEFFTTMNYHLEFKKYSFGYEAPSIYLQAIGATYRESSDPKFRLSLMARKEISIIDLSLTVRAYKDIKYPSTEDTNRVLYLLLLRALHSRFMRPEESIEALNIANNIIPLKPESLNRYSTLLYSYIYEFLAFLYMNKGKNKLSIELYKKVINSNYQSPNKLPNDVLVLVSTIVSKLDNEEVDNEDVIHDVNTLDDYFTKISSYLYYYFTNKIITSTERHIQDTEARIAIWPGRNLKEQMMCTKLFGKYNYLPNYWNSRSSLKYENADDSIPRDRCKTLAIYTPNRIANKIFNN